MANKILFLDFDGVLTSDAFSRICFSEHRQKNMFGLDWFDPQCLNALRKIVEETGAVIVVSSSWRDLGEDKLVRLWRELNMPGELYGNTPEWVLTKREAILQWLEDNDSDIYVIVDDSEMGLPNSYKTNPSTGLTIEDAERIINVLNEDKENDE